MQQLDRNTWENRVGNYRANVQEKEENFTVGCPCVFSVMSAVAVRTVTILLLYIKDEKRIFGCDCCSISYSC